ncbi:MAG: hypothetical protein JXQ96_08525 [Cyclobacteriaceae bacterium]
MSPRYLREYLLVAFTFLSFASFSQKLIIPQSNFEVTLGDRVEFLIEKNSGSFEFTEIEMSKAPAGATLNSETGDFTWTPTEDDLGTTGIIFYLLDSNSIVLAEDIVTIHVEGQNRPPVLEVESMTVNAEPTQFTPGQIFINEKDKVHITARIKDENPEKLFFTYFFNGDINQRELSNATVLFNTASQQIDFSYEPNESQARTGHVDWNVKLLDQSGKEGNFNLRINIANVDFPPVILNKPSKKSIKDEFVYRYRPIIDNDDNDKLVFQYQPDEDIKGINMDDTTGEITWDINSAYMVENKTYRIYMKVSERDEPAHFDEITLELVWSATNKPPVIKAIPGWNVKEGIENTYQIIAEDPNLDDELTYYFAGGSSFRGMTMDEKTGILTFVPPYSMVSKANGTMDIQVGIRVMDKKGLDIVAQVPIKVFDRPDPNRLNETYEHLTTEMSVMLDKSQEVRDKMIYLDGRLKSKRRTTTIVLSAITLAGAIFSGLPDDNFLRKASPGIVGAPAAYSLILAIDIKDEELITTLKQQAAELSTILDHKMKRLKLYESVEKEQLSNDPEFISLINQYNNDETLRDEASRLNRLKTGFSTISNIKKYQKILRRYDNRERKRGLRKYFDRNSKQVE